MKMQSSQWVEKKFAYTKKGAAGQVERESNVGCFLLHRGCCASLILMSRGLDLLIPAVQVKSGKPFGTSQCVQGIVHPG
jgi:hypothetical protein